MRIGCNIDGGQDLDELIAKLRQAVGHGYATAWLPQPPGGGPRKRSARRRRHELFGFDSLTALAAASAYASGIEVGTCVVPTFPRHPMVLAEQATTVQAAYAGRLTLGIGVSHRHVVEDQWGYVYDRTALRMREYVQVLDALFTEGEVAFEGKTVSARGSLTISTQWRTPILVAALGERMLDVAGELTDGTVTWMTGSRTLAEHVVPRLSAAADRAGRPSPRTVASLPVCVTHDVAERRELTNRLFLLYRSLPNYKAMLDREGVSEIADIALIGSEEEVVASIARLADSGVTDLNALVVGDEAEQARAHALLPQLSDAGPVRTLAGSSEEVR